MSKPVLSGIEEVEMEINGLTRPLLPPKSSSAFPWALGDRVFYRSMKRANFL
jgi:hypothetical protein